MNIFIKMKKKQMATVPTTTTTAAASTTSTTTVATAKATNLKEFFPNFFFHVFRLCVTPTGSNFFFKTKEKPKTTNKVVK